MTALAYGTVAVLLVAGLLGVVTTRNLIHLVGCLAVAQSSTYVLLLAVGLRSGGRAPVATGAPPPTAFVDPVVQALALTDVVVGAVVTALLLALAIQAHKRFRTLDPRDMRSLRG
ncbi:MAG TPA: NADH-quinone oxidoreductase subunit K [Anaeromyxobacter sp.]